MWASAGGNDNGPMANLRFETPPEQLRRSRPQLAGSFGLAAALIATCLISGIGFANIVRALAGGAAIITLIGAWSYRVSSRAFTECTPHGMRTLSFGGEKALPWALVSDITITAYRNTMTIMVTASTGTRFRLGGLIAYRPAHVPGFTENATEIISYWKAAAPGSGAAPGPAEQEKDLQDPAGP